MKERLKQLCDQFLAAKAGIKDVFGMEYDEIYTLCANMLVSRGKLPDAAVLRRCRELLKTKVGIFSSFRGTMEAPVCCLMSVADEPEQKFARIEKAHSVLKRHFGDSQYLVYASAVLSDMPTEIVEGVSARARNIYDLMKRRHPFLTSYEDHVFCVLLAMSERSDEELISETEQIYKSLNLSDSNTMQSVSHILALAEGDPAEKCDILKGIFNGLKEVGKKYGTYGELAVLAALAAVSPDITDAVTDIADADDYLSLNKEYRGFFNCGEHTRLMHAALITAASYAPVGSDISGTLPMIAAEDALLYIYDASSDTMVMMTTM